MAAPEVVKGVLNLVAYETPPLIRWPLVVGDTFTRIITVSDIGTDYTGYTAMLILKDAKPPAGVSVFQDVTIPMFDITIPSISTDAGIAKFTINIPSNVTTLWSEYKTLYGRIRLLKPDASVEGLASCEMSVIPT